jgi:hypothetical protein
MLSPFHAEKELSTYGKKCIPSSNLNTKAIRNGSLFYFVLILNNINNMKTITMKPVEFYHFRQLAFAMSIAFACTIAQGVYIVEANIDQLEKLGY